MPLSERRDPLSDSAPARARPVVAWKIGLLVAATVGFVVWTGSFDHETWAGLLRCVQQMGWTGFTVYLLYSASVYLLLGASWHALLPGGGIPRLRLLTWARMVREATSDLLPFSQLGGIVFGMRVVIDAGLASARVYASFIGDIAAEIVSQAFITVAILIVFVFDGGTLFPGAAWGGDGGVLVLVIAGLLVIGIPIARRWLPTASTVRILRPARDLINQVAAEMKPMLTQPASMARCVALNAIAWRASALGAWLALRTMGLDVAAKPIVELEVMVFAVRSLAFAIPAGIGAQELGYALLAPWIGLPVEAGIALAFAKRARDIALMVPVLLVWQYQEGRKVLRVAR